MHGHKNIHNHTFYIVFRYSIQSFILYFPSPLSLIYLYYLFIFSFSSSFSSPSLSSLFSSPSLSSLFSLHHLSSLFSLHHLSSLFSLCVLYMRSLPPPRITRKRRWLRIKRAVTELFTTRRVSDRNCFSWPSRVSTLHNGHFRGPHATTSFARGAYRMVLGRVLKIKVRL